MPLSEADLRSTALAVFRAWNDHDVEAVVGYLAGDVLWDWPVNVSLYGKDAVRDELTDTLTGFPDIHFPVEEIELFTRLDPPAVVATWTATGTLSGHLEMGLPVTGRSFHIRGTTLMRLRDEAVSEWTTTFDTFALLQQLGVMPETDELRFRAGVLTTMITDRVRTIVTARARRARRR